MFDIVLHSIQKSAEELNDLREADKTLLHICADDDMNESHYIVRLLEDEARAGRHFVSGGSYASLVKAAVNVICAK
jgi:glutathionylspermidine synthase